MKSVTQPEIEADPNLRSGVAQANRLLEEILGRSGERVTADWQLFNDERGRTGLALKLADYTGYVSARFAPDELDSQDHMRVRLHRLWGDLLQVRSTEQIQKLAEMVRDQVGN